MFWRGLGGHCEGHAPAPESRIVKEPKSHCCYQTANAVVIMLAELARLGQGKNGD